MKSTNLIFTVFFVGLCAFDTMAAPSKCSKANLTRCLDSACAINIGMNPAARCQYCGTSSAGTPPSQKGLSNVTVGQSTKYNLTERELRTAPSDPGKRYIWASTECIKKLPDCTPDDVSDTYDKLIEQSCKTAGINMQISNAVSNAIQKPSKSKCNTTFTTCMNAKCGTAFDGCNDDSDFDRFVAECASDASGCDDYIAEFRTAFAADRKNTFARRESLVQTLVDKYKSRRESRIKNTTTACNNGTASKSCIDRVCANNMPGKCKESIEKSMATQLCKFYDTACTVLK